MGISLSSWASLQNVLVAQFMGHTTSYWFVTVVAEDDDVEATVTASLIEPPLELFCCSEHKLEQQSEHNTCRHASTLTRFFKMRIIISQITKWRSFSTAGTDIACCGLTYLGVAPLVWYHFLLHLPQLALWRQNILRFFCVEVFWRNLQSQKNKFVLTRVVHFIILHYQSFLCLWQCTINLPFTVTFRHCRIFEQCDIVTTRGDFAQNKHPSIGSAIKYFLLEKLPTTAYCVFVSVSSPKKRATAIPLPRGIHNLLQSSRFTKQVFNAFIIAVSASFKLKTFSCHH